MAITKAQMTDREAALLAAVRNASASPGPYVSRICGSYANKVADTLRKLWGVYRRHLRVPRPLTLTMALFDPHHIAYYFRLVASAESPGRNYSPATLATEVLLLRHLLQAFMGLATRSEAGRGGHCSIMFNQMPHGLDAGHVLSWLKHDVTRDVSWKPTVGGRRKERDLVCNLVSEPEFEEWVHEVQATADDLIATEKAGGLPRTIEMAEHVQDVTVSLLLGPGMPPQRADVLATMLFGIGK